MFKKNILLERIIFLGFSPKKIILARLKRKKSYGKSINVKRMRTWWQRKLESWRMSKKMDSVK
jgi:hypothetical protein